MLCVNCSKLAIQFLNKKCIRCQGHISQNISILCETCSGQHKQCSACLKKINDINVNKKRYGGCSSCRR